jgi:hypothetical protein
MKRFYQFYLIAFVLLSDFVMFAQPGDDDGGGGLEGDDTPAAPIDGKLIWLAIAGILFSVYYFKSKQQKA